MRILLALMICLAVLPLSAREFDAAATQAGVASADGKVDKQIHGGRWERCGIGDILTTGDRIRAGADSSASLLFTDKTVMRLGANTTITLIDLSETDDGTLVRKFEQQGGRSWSDVTPNPAKPTTYEVRGPNAVAAVKGTSFEMDAESGQTDVLCWEGEVQCLAEGETAPQAVSQDRQFRARRGQKPTLQSFAGQAPDGFQNWALEYRQRQRALWATLPPRVKLEASMLRGWAQKYHIKLTAGQRQRLKKALHNHLQQHPPGNKPGWGRKPR